MSQLLQLSLKNLALFYKKSKSTNGMKVFTLNMLTIMEPIDKEYKSFNVYSGKIYTVSKDTLKIILLLPKN